MGYRKYAKDYESELYTDIRGRLHTKAVYKGAWYRYAAEEKTLRRYLLRDCGFTLLAWAALFGALLLNCSAGRTIYVVLPTACGFLPLVYVSWSLLTAFLHKPPMKREHAQGVYERRCSASLILMIFALAALAGYAAMLVFKRELLFLPEDPVYGVLLLVLAGMSVLLFRGRRGYATQEIQNDNPAENA